MQPACAFDTCVRRLRVNPAGHRSRNTSRRAARGMSLLEILLVVALIAAITTVLAIATTGGMDGVRLRSSSKEIAAELRRARAQAIATGTVQRFVIDPERRSWTGANDRSGKVPKGIDVLFVGAREVQRKRDEGAILFFEDGASTGGRIQLSAKRAAWNVDVAWLTGEVGIHRGQPGAAR